MAGETIEQYIRHLHELADHCDFPNKEEEIRDRLVIGIRDKDLSLKLQMTSDLTLKKAAALARRSELVKFQIRETGAAENVDEVKTKLYKSKWRNKAGVTSTHKAEQRRKCGRCGCSRNRALSSKG